MAQAPLSWEKVTVSFRFILPIMVAYMLNQNQEIKKNIQDQTVSINTLSDNLGAYKLENQGRMTKLEMSGEYISERLTKLERNRWGR